MGPNIEKGSIAQQVPSTIPDVPSSKRTEKYQEARKLMNVAVTLE
jgi:hypothetical protein